jgi:hypothetical protein
MLGSEDLDGAANRSSTAALGHLPNQVPKYYEMRRQGEYQIGLPGISLPRRGLGRNLLPISTFTKHLIPRCADTASV